MNILGIETSCDETAASVVHAGRTILSNAIASSLKEHQKFGGIIPEIASRRQLELIHAIVETALEKAHLKLADIVAIAFTSAPGLIGSLLVGTSFARAIGFAAQKPLIEVDHIKAHIYANFLTFADQTKNTHIRTSNKAPRLPAIGLIISGGHSSLYQVQDHTHYKLLGQTRDDAAGEAFDKVARILGLGYPGGPVIDQLAKKGAGTKIRFPQAELAEKYDFSFSGLKTAVLYYKNKHEKDTDFSVPQVAFAFQESVVNTLTHKALTACRGKKITTLLVGGGVAANSTLRQKLCAAAQEEGINVYFPPLSLCIDNAAMIAGFGFHLYKN